MDKTIRQVIGNPKDLFDHLAGNCLKYNWYVRPQIDGGLGTESKTRLLSRFGCWIGGEDGSWCNSWDDNVFATLDEALNVGFELLLEQWSAEYVLAVYLNPDIDPLKDQAMAKAISEMERNPQ